MSNTDSRGVWIPVSRMAIRRAADNVIKGQMMAMSLKGASNEEADLKIKRARDLDQHASRGESDKAVYGFDDISFLYENIDVSSLHPRDSDRWLSELAAAYDEGMLKHHFGNGNRSDYRATHDSPHPPMISHQIMELEPVKFKTNRVLTEQSLTGVHDPQHMITEAADGLVLAFSAYIYGMKVDEQVGDLSYSDKRTVTASFRREVQFSARRLSAVLFVLGGLSISLSPLFWPLMVVGLALAMAGFIDAYRTRSDMITFTQPVEVTVSGKANATAQDWMLFPSSAMQFPPELGRPVPYREVQMPVVDKANITYKPIDQS